MANIYGEKSNLKVQWEKVKQGTLQQKFDWFVTYFGLYTLLALGAVALVLFLTLSSCGKKPSVIRGMFLDRIPTEEAGDALKKTLCASLNVDEAKYGIELYGQYPEQPGTVNQYEQQEALFARVSAGELDFICGTEALFSYYYSDSAPSASVFAPLPDLLPDELLKDLQDAGRLVYRNPNAAAPVPYFVNIGGTALAEQLHIKEDDYLLALAVTAKNQDAVVLMLTESLR